MIKNINQQILRYDVVFQEAQEGGFTAYVPALAGCVSEGDSFEEAKGNNTEAILAYLESLGKDGQKIVVPAPAFMGGIDINANEIA